MPQHNVILLRTTATRRRLFRTLASHISFGLSSLICFTTAGTNTEGDNGS
jgi:hypothetical protein